MMTDKELKDSTAQSIAEVLSFRVRPFIKWAQKMSLQDLMIIRRELSEPESQTLGSELLVAFVNDIPYKVV